MEEIRKLAQDCREVATFYEESPGMFGVRAAVDLYRAIARLCDLLEAQDKKPN